MNDETGLLLLLTNRSTRGITLGMTFGAFVKEKRVAKGLSLRAAASRVGVDSAYLSRVEAGKTRPSDHLVEELAPVLGCPPDDLAMMAGHLPARLREALKSNGHRPSDVLRDFATSYLAERSSSAADDPTSRETRIAGTALRPRKPSRVAALRNSQVDQLKHGNETSAEATSPTSDERKVDPRNRLNALTSTEWVPETVSVWNQRGLGAGHPDAQIERQHPAPFSFTDVARLIRFFSKPDDVVLDPFVGVGSTLKACALENRCGIGIDLNPRYVKLARERLRKEIHDRPADFAQRQRLIRADARTAVKSLPTGSVDFVVTSPPYWNILHKEDHKAKRERKAHDLDTRYGNDKRDLGNTTSYHTFLGDLSAILGECGRALKPKKYMAVIISDFRDKANFVMFHADLATSLTAFNFGVRGLKVLYQRHKKVFPYGYPYAYVPNIHHQYILILQNER